MVFQLFPPPPDLQTYHDLVLIIGLHSLYSIIIVLFEALLICYLKFIFLTNL